VVLVEDVQVVVEQQGVGKRLVMGIRWTELLLAISTKELNSTITVGFLTTREITAIKDMGYKVTPITNSYNLIK
jgi:hypothetical protein